MNVKQELFSDALTEIDSHYLEQALHFSGQQPSLKKPFLRRLPYRTAAALAACFCLLLTGIGIGLYNHLSPKYPASREQSWPIRNIPAPNPAQSEGEPGGELAEILHWEDLPIYHQYSEIQIEDPVYQNITYQVRDKILPEEQVHDFLLSDIDSEIDSDPEESSVPDGISASGGFPVTVKGWDEYADIAGENAERTTTALLYSIAGISREAAAAVRYEGSDTYYVAINSLYRPQTLEQFWNDLNLENNLFFHYALYEYQKSSGEFATVRFDPLDQERIRTLLLANPNAENEYDDLDHFPFEYEKLLDFSIDVPLLGYENISISLWEGGYLETNILDTGKRFRIGEESIQALIDYVLTECEGYEIVYTYENTEDHTFIPE